MAKPLTKKDKQGIAVIAAAIAVIVALGGAQAMLRKQQMAYDGETLCPKDRPYPHTVVLVDKTDPLSSTQQAYLRTRLLELRDHMRPMEKLTILVLEDQEGAGTPRFNMCNPGSGKEANELYQNPRKIQARYDQQFGAPLDHMLADLLTGQTRPHSAIMEAVRDVAALPDFRDNSPGRRLIIFSDMVQNVQEFSQYAKLAPFDAFSKSDYGNWMLRTSLAGADVSVIYLLRQQYKNVQTRAHVYFWEKYFAALDANLKEVDPVQ